MKICLRLFIVFSVTFILFFQSVNACTIEVPKLRKVFRNSNSVFTGKVTKVVEYRPTETEKQKVIPEVWRDWTVFSKVTVEVKQKWKGNLPKTKEFIAVAFFDCGCPGFKIDEFEIGEEYLIYAEKKILSLFAIQD